MHVCSVYPVAAQNWQRPFWRFVQVIYKVVFANADSIGPKVTVANCYEKNCQNITRFAASKYRTSEFHKDVCNRTQGTYGVGTSKQNAVNNLYNLPKASLPMM